jgi:hypothetical protein
MDLPSAAGGSTLTSPSADGVKASSILPVVALKASTRSRVDHRLRARLLHLGEVAANEDTGADPHDRPDVPVDQVGRVVDRVCADDSAGPHPAPWKERFM